MWTEESKDLCRLCIGSTRNHATHWRPWANEAEMREDGGRERNWVQKVKAVDEMPTDTAIKTNGCKQPRRDRSWHHLHNWSKLICLTFWQSHYINHTFSQSEQIMARLHHLNYTEMTKMALLCVDSRVCLSTCIL